MTQSRSRGSARPTRRADKASGKVAITPRLDAARVRPLQAIAEAENRILTHYVETALIRDLASRDEAAWVITMQAAAGTSDHVAPADIERGDGESDEAFATRRDLLTELWSIPDSA